MTSTANPAPAAAIDTRAQLDALVENITRLRAERAEFLRAQESEINDVRLRYRAPLAEIEKFLDVETGWAEAWARSHPGALSAARTLACPHATIGFRADPPRIERASRRWTWTRIAATLGELAWGQCYLRTPEPQVDKEAIVADLPSLSREELRAAGIKIIQGDRFYVAPHAAEAATPETAWREAA